jgi:hypothetical protein
MEGAHTVQNTHDNFSEEGNLERHETHEKQKNGASTQRIEEAEVHRDEFGDSLQDYF